MTTAKKVYEFEIQYQFPSQPGLPTRWLKALNVDLFESLEKAKSALTFNDDLVRALKDGFVFRVVKREKVPEKVVYELRLKGESNDYQN